MSPRTVKTLSSFTKHATLANVRTLRVSGDRLSEDDDGFDSESFQVELGMRVDGQVVQGLAQGQCYSKHCRFEADIEVTFHVDERYTASEEIVAEFCNRIVVPTAFPYLREAVHSLALRLGVSQAPLIGFMDSRGVDTLTREKPS